VSAIFRCTIKTDKVQKFSPGTGSTGWSRKNGRKTLVVVVVWYGSNVAQSELTKIGLQLGPSKLHSVEGQVLFLLFPIMYGNVSREYYGKYMLLSVREFDFSGQQHNVVICLRVSNSV